jgi:hypothetical protein
MIALPQAGFVRGPGPATTPSVPGQPVISTATPENGQNVDFSKLMSDALSSPTAEAAIPIPTANANSAGRAVLSASEVAPSAPNSQEPGTSVVTRGGSGNRWHAAMKQVPTASARKLATLATNAADTGNPPGKSVRKASGKSSDEEESKNDDSSSKPEQQPPGNGNADLAAIPIAMALMAAPQTVHGGLSEGEESRGDVASLTDVMARPASGHPVGARVGAAQITGPGEKEAAAPASNQFVKEGSRTIPGFVATNQPQGKSAAQDAGGNQIQESVPPITEARGGGLQGGQIQPVKDESSHRMLAAETTVNASVMQGGTSAAQYNQRMKSAAEKNKIAGSTVQKLPVTAGGGDFSVEPNGKVAGTATRGTPGRNNGTEIMPPVINFESRISQSSGGPSAPSAASQFVDRTAQLERAAELVTREVVMLRQSGGNSLAVSLKLDTHTELFLQLTNHGGQVQASLRCERGDMTELGSQWGQLQESLSRHNVQLLPFEDRSTGRNQSFAQDDNGAGAFQNSNGKSSPQNPQPQLTELPDETVTVTRPSAPERGLPTTKNNSNRKGWETWA